MNQNKQPEALRFSVESEMSHAFEIEYGQSWTDPDWRREAGIWASAWHKATNAELRRLHAESELHLQELRSYRITVENREARIAELEGRLVAAQQCVPDVEPVAWVATFKPEGLLALHSVVGANLEDLKQSVPSNSVFRPLYTHPTTQGLDAERLRNLLCKMVDQLERRWKYRDGNAPGHGHSIPGVWDSDNGELAGQKCAWCEVWQEALEVRDAAQAKQGGV